MFKRATKSAAALLLMGGLFLPAAAADHSAPMETQRGEFNPFSVRPTVRPTLRFSPFSWFGGRSAVNRVPVPPTRQQQSPPPVTYPQLGAAIHTADEEPTPPTTTVQDEESPARSPFRPALRGPF